MLLSILVQILIVQSCISQEECPNRCTCKRGTQKDGYLKISCGEQEKISSLEEVELLNVANELVQLNLSENYLKTFSLIVELPMLQKLDLSKNHMTELQPYQFKLMPMLRRLDISSNNIKHIDVLAFEGLKHLERLKLNQNNIATITFGTFDPLINIKQLDISSNPLICDCGLLWILDWSQQSSVKLLSNPKCNFPAAFKGQLLRKLKIGDDILCKSPAETGDMPIIDLTPKEDQVVFEGDSLTLRCYAPTILDTYDDSQMSKMEWMWSGFDPKAHFSDVQIDGQIIPSAGRIWSTLHIISLSTNHTGIWSCLLVSIHGNYSEDVSLIVISPSTHYCPTTMTVNNKGTYSWPRTLLNYTVTLPCEQLNLNYDAGGQRASYTCSDKGVWTALNTTPCSYISEHTKILEQFSKVNSSIEESAKHFRNYTSNLSIFKDIVDLHFAVETIANYLKYAPMEHISTIGIILMDVANNLMELPMEYLRKTNSEYGSSRKLLEAMEKLAIMSTSLPFHQTNFALESFHVKKDAFQDMKCTWYVNPANRRDCLFSCTWGGLHQQQTNDAAGSGNGVLQGKSIEASVTVPADLFDQLRQRGMNLQRKDYNLLVAMHRNNKLFAVDDKKVKEDVTSAVVGVELADIPVINLSWSSPVYVMLRTPPTNLYEVMPFVPVWWDPALGDNSTGGAWSTDGCRFSHQLPDHIVFSCHHFGYYGLMQDVSQLRTNYATSGSGKFKLSHPAIYVGAFILFTSFVIVILTYLFCYFNIQMPKKAKHSLINTWLSIVLLCYMYVFGIYQTDDVKVCQSIGMVLHYFTLCSLLWMCVSVNCMYKRLNKHQDAINLQDDDLPSSDQPIRKPIMGLYLVGWGIGLIICGLSAAININEYASHSYCFLRSGPALSALYIPFSILALFLSVMFLLIRCSIYNMDANGHLSEGTQATEHVDLELLEPNFPNATNTIPADNRSVRSMSSKTGSSQSEDTEHSPSAQLKAHVIFLLIYVMTWLSCAFATVSPFQLFSFEEQLFSVAFATLATTLSAFTLFFYCVARNDVRSQWMVFMRWMKRKRIICVKFRSRNVSDTTVTPQIQIQPLPPLPIAASVQTGSVVVSRSTSRSSTHTKSNASNILKGAVDLNGSFSDNNQYQGARINNVNLVVLHRQQYRANVIPNIIENPTNAAEVFYNPHQSTVARKFFKRQKRNMMKKNNLAKPPRDINSDTASVFSEPKIKNAPDPNIFGTNTKVNNTNIHVEHIKRVQQKNPNIFSDSAEDFDSVSNVPPVDNIVINAERLRKREMSKHRAKKKHNNPSKSQSEHTDKNMRSVSQQCTLEYSSETISDSILDKASPDKLLMANQDSFVTENISAVTEAMLRRDNSPLSILTENDPNYCQINELRTNKSPQEYLHHRRKIKQQNRDPLVMYSTGEASGQRIYMNQDDECKNESSISVSDLDELYQQIRRGAPQSQQAYSRRSTRSGSRYHNHPTQPYCYLSDSEVNSCVSDVRHRRTASHSHLDLESRYSDDVETTV